MRSDAFSNTRRFLCTKMSFFAVATQCLMSCRKEARSGGSRVGAGPGRPQSEPVSDSQKLRIRRRRFYGSWGPNLNFLSVILAGKKCAPWVQI